MLRIRKGITVSIFLFSAITGAFSQEEKATSERSEYSIFDLLSQPQGGVISISQPYKIKALVGSPKRESAPVSAPARTTRSVAAYRIQAYMGNTAQSKQEVNRRKAIIQRAFPGIPCYISYRAPFWTLKIGDFSNREEAESLLKELRRKLPRIAPESYVVREKGKR